MTRRRDPIVGVIARNWLPDGALADRTPRLRAASSARMRLSHAFALALALAPAPLAALTPTDAVARTRVMLRDVCTALNAPCNSCGEHRAGPPPSPRPADDPLRRPIDAWGRGLQITVGGDGVHLRSAGADGELGTGDDLVEACGAPKGPP